MPLFRDSRSCSRDRRKKSTKDRHSSPSTVTWDNPHHTPQNLFGVDFPSLRVLLPRFSRRNPGKVSQSKEEGRSMLCKTQSMPCPPLENLAQPSYGPSRSSSVPRKKHNTGGYSSPLGTGSIPTPPDVGSNRLVEKESSFHKSLRNALNEHERDFMCAICLEILYRPRQLSCGHAFCLTCLQSYSNTCLNRLTCPSCRQPVKQPPYGVTDLPRNQQLEKMVDRARARRRTMTRKGQICLRCHSEVNVKECIHCRKGWCEVCYPSHLKIIKEEVLRLKEHIQESKDRLQCKREEEETKFGKLEEKVTNAIDEKKIELMSQIKNLRDTSDENVKRLTKEVETTLNDLLHENSNKTSWDQVWKRCNEIHQLLTRSSSSLDQRITFDTNSFTLTTVKEDVLHSPPLRRTSSAGSEDPDKQDDDRLILPRDRGPLYRKKTSFPKYRWGHNICSRPAGVAISPWTGHIFVTASDSCKIHIFDENGKQVSSFGSRGHEDGCFMCPIGITFSTRNKELYITDKWKHCIHVFDPEGRFLRQMGKKGKGFGEFFSPEGVATDTNGKIYVADTCNDRVQILDSDGVYEGEVGLVSSEVLGHGRRYTKSEFNEPVGVAVSPDGSRIYVADSGNHRIKVFDGYTGTRQLSFGSRGHNKAQFESPESVAVDEKGFIFVGDSGNGRVQIFRSNGYYVRSLGGLYNKKGEFGWVSGIALRNNSEIIVTDFKNNTIAAF